MHMTKRTRLRRTGILCCHCLRNMAFYRSWYAAGTPFKDKQFWVTAKDNFLDVTILEWCKLFGDAHGKHYYLKAVDDPTQFRMEMLSHLAATEDAFADYVDQMRTYRDKFVAHLDDLNTIQVPYLTIAKSSTIFLYQRLLAQEAANDTFHDAPKSATDHFNLFFSQGKAEYTK